MQPAKKRTKARLRKQHQPWFKELEGLTRVARTRAYWLSLFSNSLAMMSPVFVLQVYDKVIFYQNLDTLTALLFGMFVVIVLEYAFRYTRSRILRSIAIYCDVFSVSALFRHLFKLPLRDIEKRSTAFWTNAFTDLERVRNRLSGTMAVGFMDFPFAFLMLGLLYVIARPVFFVPVVFIVIVLILIWRANHVMERAIAKEQVQIQQRSGRLADLITSRETIKSMNMSEAAYDLWAKSQSDVIDRSVHRGGSHDYYENLGQTITLLSSVILVTLGALAIIEGSMTMGGLIAANMLSGRAMGASVRMIGLWRLYRESIEAESRIDEIFALKVEISKASMPLLDWQGAISLEKVQFNYDKSEVKALDQVNALFSPGNFYGIIGPNGGGKSTLLRVMRSLYKPNEGHVYLDKQDIQQFTQEELAQSIGYLPQEPSLIAASIYQNLTFGILRDLDAQDVKKACADAGCLDFISSQPQGFDTQIGDAGLILTPGLRQKISLARLYLRQPSALLLDEPTNHLDEEALISLENYLVLQAKEKLVAVVSHNLRLLKRASVILIVEKGKILRSGPATLILSSIGVGNG